MRNEKAQPVSQDGHGNWDGTGCVKLLRKCQMQTSEPLLSSHIWLAALTVPLAFGLFVSEVFLYRMGVLDDVAFLRE